MRSICQCLLAAVLASIACSTFAQIRVGLLSEAQPFADNSENQGVLRDAVGLLWPNESQPPLMTRYRTRQEAIAALNSGRIDTILSARTLVKERASRALMQFPVATLKGRKQTGKKRVFAELLPWFETRPGQQVSGSDENPYNNVRALLRGEASEWIAPDFILDNLQQRMPLPELQRQPLNIPPLRYFFWIPPDRSATLREINQRIDRLSQEDTRWLEQKWQLPAGSVASERNHIAGEIGVPLRVVLSPASLPLIGPCSNSKPLQGIWLDLLNTLFPSPYYHLHLTQASDQAQAERLLSQHKVDLLIGDSVPITHGISRQFDTIIWGTLSMIENRPASDIAALRHQRLAVEKNSPLFTQPVFTQLELNLVPVDNLTQGIELVEAGGADALLGDVFSLRYQQQLRQNKRLFLSGVDLPDVPLWLVSADNDTDKMRRVNGVLRSVTPVDMQNARARWEISPPSPRNTRTQLWLSLLTLLTLLSVVGVVGALTRVRLQRKNHNQQIHTLHNQLKLWQTLLNSAPVPLFVSDPGGRVQRFNHAFRDSPFVPGTFTTGMSLTLIKEGPFSGWLDIPERLALLYDDQPHQREVTLTVEGKCYTLLCWLARYCDNRGIARGIVGGWIDISHKSRLEEILNTSLHQAEQASAEKSAFLARMSHDIRTPLHAILGMLEIEREHNPSLEVCWQAALTLRDLVGDILDLSRIEAGELRLNLTANNLRLLIYSATAIFRHSADEKGLHWQHINDIPQDYWVTCDRSRLHQIVANLAGNAIKYTSQGSVTFHSFIDKEQLILRFIDTGIGISETQRPLLFQPWYQVDSSVPQSSGLGLSICHQLVTLMNGEIHLDSTPGEGTRVEVVLPFSPTSPPKIGAQPTVETGSALRILLVDDFPANLMVMERQLERLGHLVVCCNSGAAALEQLLQAPFDILITDNQMPEMSGYQLSHTVVIKSLLGQLQRPPMILGATASALPEEEARATHAGMDGLLRKPLTEQELRQRLRNFTTVAANAPHLQSLMTLAGGDQTLFAEMLIQLRQSIDEDVSALRAILNISQLCQIAHRLKSSWQLLNMCQSWRLCQVVEGLNDQPGTLSLSAEQQRNLVEAFIVQMSHDSQRLGLITSPDAIA